MTNMKTTKLTQPAFLQWAQDNKENQYLTAITEYMEILETEDTAFQELLKYFTLESYGVSINDETGTCFHNFEFSLANLIVDANLNELVNNLQDDNNPIPAYTFYCGTLYLTIIGLA